MTEPTVRLEITAEQVLLFAGKSMNLFATLFGKQFEYSSKLANAKSQLLWVNNWLRNATRGGSVVPQETDVWKLGATLGHCMILHIMTQELANKVREADKQCLERAVMNARGMINMLNRWVEESDGISENRKLRRFYHGFAVALVRGNVSMTDCIDLLPNMPGSPILVQVLSMKLGSPNEFIYCESDFGGNRLYAGENQAGKWLAQVLERVKSGKANAENTSA